MALAATGILELSYIADTAISKSRFVTSDGDQTVKQADAAGQRALGVCPTAVSTAEAGATVGKTVRVTVLGVAWVEAGAAITALALVMTDNVGRATTATGSGSVVLGQALKASANAGDSIPVLLTPVGHAL